MNHAVDQHLVDAEGAATLVGAGHTPDAQDRLTGATVQPLPAPDQP